MRTDKEFAEALRKEVARKKEIKKAEIVSALITFTILFAASCFAIVALIEFRLQ